MPLSKKSSMSTSDKRPSVARVVMSIASQLRFGAEKKYAGSKEYTFMQTFQITFRMSHPKNETREKAMMHDSETMIHLGATDTTLDIRCRHQLLSLRLWQFPLAMFLLLKVGPRQPTSLRIHQTLNTILSFMKGALCYARTSLIGEHRTKTCRILFLNFSCVWSHSRLLRAVATRNIDSFQVCIDNKRTPLCFLPIV